MLFFPQKIVVLLMFNSSEGATKFWLFLTITAATLSYWAISNYQNKTLRGKKFGAYQVWSFGHIEGQ